LFLSPGFNVPAFKTPTFHVPSWRQCRVIATIHDLIHVRFAAERTAAKLAYYRWIQRPVIRRAPITLTVSEFSRRQIIEWYGVPETRVVCVGNGVSDEFFESGPSASFSRPFFLYVGNTKPHKNTGVLLDATRNLIRDHDIALVMVMKSNETIEKQIDIRGLQSHVTLISGLSDHELATWYRGAIGLVMPSLYEGFGLPVVEAMACGCPVIGSDRTSIPEVMDNAGILFRAEDSSHLEECMRALLDDTSVRADLKLKGTRRAPEFRWDAVANRVQNAISQYLPSKRFPAA
jgi:glycosyltransferase involved in cell wall biosynthesis